ncbi:MAG: hypothetical protein PHV05_07250, partial [Candidatus Riflebacteria bacterium]|nr:hypothetical protein [Candidatus Riflebacteria bacterium]
MNRRFAYKALDLKGKPMDGFMEAATAEEVGAWLADRNYFILDISETPMQALLATNRQNVSISA